MAGRDIKRFESPTAKRWLILFKNGDTKRWFGDLSEEDAWNRINNEYPSIAEWLKVFEAKAKKRSDQGDYWWELRACAYYDEFDKEKIMLPDISSKCEAILDNTNAFCVNTAYILPNLSHYELGILNSRLVLFFYANLTQTIRGGYFRFIRQYLEQIPIVKSNSEANLLIEKAKEVILLKNENKDTTHLESEIDQLVYALYDLTEEEIGIIEESVGR